MQERPPLIVNPPPSPAPGDDELVDFRDLWRTLDRYKWRVLGITLIATILGTLFAFSLAPTYRAGVSVLIEARLNQAVQVKEVYDPGAGTEEYYNTQSQLLKSRELAGRVVDKLSLAADPRLDAPEPSFIDSVLSLGWLPFLPDAEPTSPAAETTEHRRERAIDALLSQVKVETTWPRSQMMVVYITSPSPDMAAKLANTWGDLFVEGGLEARLDVAERASRWLMGRLADLKAKLEVSEQALQAYREKHQLVNVGGTRSLYEEEVTDNAKKLREAQNKKTQFASTYWKIQQAGKDDSQLAEISALQLDPVVQKANENLLQAEQTVKQLSERYGAKHPQMTNAQVRLDAARRSYYDQLRLAANGIKVEYEIATETERALLNVLQGGKQQIRKLDEGAFQEKSLQREVDTNRELYDLFLKRFKETDTTTSYEPMTARVVDHASVPRIPYKPEKLKVILLWTLGGLMLALLLTALRHILSEVVRSPDQLEHLTQLPVLCVLPPVPGLGRKVRTPALSVEQPRAPFSEGVRSIRASLYLSDVDRRMKRIMFTSALPREGKSSVAAGFAVSLGQMERVLLLDADLRAPTQKKNFGIPDDWPGLVEVLTAQAKLDQAIFRHAATGISVLPVAQLPANPAEVVSSAAFLKLLEILAGKFDRIVFDSPPCQVASDSLLLANRMDAVIFVIHGASTGYRTIQAAVKHLRGAHAPLLGHVLNQVDARKAYGYHGQYYSYGYGQN